MESQYGCSAAIEAASALLEMRYSTEGSAVARKGLRRAGPEHDYHLNIRHPTTGKEICGLVSSQVLSAASFSFFKELISHARGNTIFLSLSSPKMILITLEALHGGGQRLLKRQDVLDMIGDIDNFCGKYGMVPALADWLAYGYRYNPSSSWRHNPRCLELFLLSAYHDRSTENFRNISAICIRNLHPDRQVLLFKEIPQPVIQLIYNQITFIKEKMLSLIGEAYKSMERYDSEFAFKKPSGGSYAKCCRAFRRQYYQDFVFHVSSKEKYSGRAVEEVLKCFEGLTTDAKSLHLCGAGNECPLQTSLRWVKNESFSICTSHERIRPPWG